MGGVLSIIYICLFSFFILKLKWVKQIQLSVKLLLSLYFFKLLGGFANFYIMESRFYGGDAKSFYNDIHNFIATSSPLQILEYFLWDWTPFKSNEHFFSAYNSVFWSDLGSQLNYRLGMLCDLLGNGNFIVYVVIYNSLFFLGQLLILKTFNEIFPTKRTLFLLVIFFIPSVWFWCSGVHKDGFLMMSLAGFFYNLNKIVLNNKNKISSKILLAFFFFMVFAIRYYILIALIPAVVLFLINAKVKAHARKISLGFLALYSISILFIGKILPQFNLLNVFVIKQQQFLKLLGGSFIGLEPLHAAPLQFIKNIPSALNHTLMRPYIWEAKDALYLLSGLETIVLLAIMVYLILNVDLKIKHPLILSIIVLSFAMFMVIGLIVPFSGAFVRYRSCYFPILFCALIAGSKVKDGKLNLYL